MKNGKTAKPSLRIVAHRRRAYELEREKAKAIDVRHSLNGDLKQ